MQRTKRFADVVIVGTGASGLYCALQLPRDRSILMLTKAGVEESDSFLAQGGICVLREEADYDSFFEDTLRAGHYLNNVRSVELMIRSSRQTIRNLLDCGVEFARNGEDFAYTREGAHSRPRILFHQDVTGKEITSKLLAGVRALPNVTILEHTRMIDLIARDGRCYGVLTEESECYAADTVLATGGIGGLYENSTNFPHLTGDALAVCLRHGVPLKDVDYIQIHPTTLYSQKPGRRFLISESVRGEGAKLYDGQMQRFVNELLPRDELTKAIRAQMKKEGSKFVWLDMSPVGKSAILDHFPNIYAHCLEEGIDVTRQPIPVVPAQHYFMGGVAVDEYSRTGMAHLYAVGETACNGVHGANRLASNSLLESLVFAGRAASRIALETDFPSKAEYLRLQPQEPEHINRYAGEIREEIERMKKSRE